MLQQASADASAFGKYEALGGHGGDLVVDYGRWLQLCYPDEVVAASDRSITGAIGQVTVAGEAIRAGASIVYGLPNGPSVRVTIFRDPGTSIVRLAISTD